VKGKTPVRPGTDQPCEWRKTENRYSWEQVQKIPGDYGIILDKTGLVCIDFDKCLLPSGSIADDRIDTMVRRLESWTEISSSGTGLHTWIVTDANTPNIKPGNGFEIISDGHVKVTGNSFPPSEKLPIRLVDGGELRKILQLDGTGNKSPGPRARHPDEKIPEGQRNNELFRMAARLRSNGMSAAGIVAALLEENRARCIPPLPDDEVMRIAGSAGSYPPGTPAEPVIVPRGLTEVAAAEKFVETIAGGYLFNASTNRWHAWTGKVWDHDGRNLIKNQCRSFVKTLYADLAGITDKSERSAYLADIERLNTKKGIENIVALAGFQLTRRSEDFNTNPHILNMQNGTLEFTDCGIRFREHRKEDMCSFIAGCEYQPEASIPDIWTDHMIKIASEDPELVATMQMVFGYCLEGGNPLEKIVTGYGAGRNGKSVTFRTLIHILGSYAVVVNPLTLMQTGNKLISPERLKMRNVRLIVAQEPSKPSDQPGKETSVLDTGFLKAASGKDPVSARCAHSNEVEEFAVSGVVVISTNYLPTVNDSSIAFWDRLILLPFDHYFSPEARDPDIEEKLTGQLPGILNWFIQGWLEYRRTKTIKLCETVKTVLEEYQNTDNEYAAYFKDSIEVMKGAETTGADFYNDYVSWCKCRYKTPKNSTRFGDDMNSRFSKKRTKRGIIYQGICIHSGQQQVSGVVKG